MRGTTESDSTWKRFGLSTKAGDSLPALGFYTEDAESIVFDEPLYVAVAEAGTVT
jgi:hypothetical protein